MHIVQVENGKIVMEYDGREFEFVLHMGSPPEGTKIIIMENHKPVHPSEAEFIWMQFCKELLEMRNELADCIEFD